MMSVGERRRPLFAIGGIGSMPGSKPTRVLYLRPAVGRRFSQSLRRHLSLSQLVQAWRVLARGGSQGSGHMLRDWSQLDLTALCQETLFGGQQQPRPSLHFLYRRQCHSRLRGYALARPSAAVT